MNEKKSIKISLSTFFLILSLIIIIIMGFVIYKLYTQNMNKLTANTNDSNIQPITNSVEKYNNINTERNDSTPSDIIQDNPKTENFDNSMSIELAYGILNKYKAENLPDANWYITNVKLIAHGDNNTYLVSYEDINLDGNYPESASTIIEFKNGKWVTDLPGSTGFDDKYLSKYNFINYENEKNLTSSSMSIELAYGILNKYKAENLPDANWYITNVKLVAHGDNNTYLVSYEDINLDGNYPESASTTIELKNGKWITDLPGSTGFDDEYLSKYNFIYY